MSRGNVFKLSGNLALGGTSDTYSTNELENIKSSLRLLKARQSQKKSEQNIDINVLLLANKRIIMEDPIRQIPPNVQN